MLPDEPLELAPLRTLVAIARCGTVTAAARSLHLSQPAATHQIRQLEGRLGVALFERRGRTLALTEAGRLVVARAERVLGELGALRADLRALAGLEVGTVRVGGVPTAVLRLLPEPIAAFRQEHPGVGFFVREGGSAVIREAVSAGELDLGVVTLPCADAALVAEPWLDDPIVIVGWPGAPLGRAPFSATRLTGEPFIHGAPGSPVRSAVEAAFVAAGVEPRVVMELESLEAIKAHVAAGLGYAALSARAVERELAAGQLVALSPEGLALSRRLGLVWRAGAPLAPAVAAFLARLRAL